MDKLELTFEVEKDTRNTSGSRAAFHSRLPVGAALQPRPRHLPSEGGDPLTQSQPPITRTTHTLPFDELSPPP
jgi:hypothetical protein